MSDREVADAVCRDVEQELKLRFRSSRSGVDALAEIGEQVSDEIRLKIEVLFAARDRLAVDPDFTLADSTGFDRIATEVLADLRARPEKLAAFRELPVLRATRPRRPEPEPEPPIRGATGGYAWLLGLAVATAMAMSIWL